MDILRRAKANVILASVGRSLKILGSNGTSFMADRTISTAAESTYDLIILPVSFYTCSMLIKLVKGQRRIVLILTLRPLLIDLSKVLHQKKVQNAHRPVDVTFRIMEGVHLLSKC